MSEQTKNKIFWITLVVLILISIILTYIRIFIKKDYMIMSEVSCDSSVESCFVHTPEELCEESEDFSCVENTEEVFYKIIYKKASNIEYCNPSDLEEGEECPELECVEGESEEECYYEYK